MRYFVLALLLLANPARAEDWLIKGLLEEPDDIECIVKIAGFTVVYTYRSDNPPRQMPVKGLFCTSRNYEAQANAFKAIDEHFTKYWETMQ